MTMMTMMATMMPPKQILYIITMMIAMAATRAEVQAPGPVDAERPLWQLRFETSSQGRSRLVGSLSLSTNKTARRKKATSVAPPPEEAGQQ